MERTTDASLRLVLEMPTTRSGKRSLHHLMATTEAVMLAHGFSIDLMVELVRAALATATAERVVAGKREIEVARVRITAAGRKALAERGA
jgi:hypothetical protein